MLQGSTTSPRMMVREGKTVEMKRRSSLLETHLSRIEAVLSIGWWRVLTNGMWVGFD